MLPAEVFLLGILIFKGLIVWCLYELFSIEGLNKVLLYAYLSIWIQTHT
jgi:hypothetical protein